LSSWRAASNAASMPAAAGGGVVVPAVRWGWLSSTTVVASVWPPARCDRPALEREVVSPSVSLSRREGWEEAATEWMSTMVMKLKTKNVKKNLSPFLACQMSKWFYNIFTGTATRAASYDSLFEKGFRLLVVR
jgi:hypothetical protein